MQDYYKKMWDHQKSIEEKYKNSTYKEILKETNISNNDNGYEENLYAEDLLDFLKIEGYGYHNVEFLVVKDSPYMWTCTDTSVGLSFILYIDKSDKRHIIAAQFQSARKNDKQYEIFDKKRWFQARRRTLEIINNEGFDDPKIASLKDKIH